MTNDKITSFSAVEWAFCPWCGFRLKDDQDISKLVRNEEEDGWNEKASRDNGFVFESSVKHCGFHIRLWVPVNDSETTIDER